MIQNTPSPAPVACVVLAAGSGTRMKSDRPKVLHLVAGVPMITHVLNACAELSPERIIVVTAPEAPGIEQAAAPHVCVTQAKPLGTGDAVKAARQALAGFQGDVIVLFGADPFVFPESLRAMQRKRQETGAAIVVSAFVVADDAKAYGRLITDERGDVLRIVEAADATPEQRASPLCNGGIMLFDAARMWALLDRLRDDNAKKEFYLTDCIALARQSGASCAVVTLPADEFLGVDTRIDLAKAEQLMQRRLRDRAMLNGVTLTDPDSVFLSADTRIGRDVIIGPNVVIGPGVDIGDKAEIRAFCHIEQARIERGAIIGPFARIRPGSTISAGAHIGNFVEIKNTTVGRGAKINHLSYVGDATVGDAANIGAGAITCNYDGFRKSHTDIGAGAFIGSNAALVAPVTIGAGAFVGAGSVITNDVAADSLAVARGRQASIEGWAGRVRDAKKDKERK